MTSEVRAYSAGRASTARCSGVEPWPSSASTLAPAAISCCTRARSPSFAIIAMKIGGAGLPAVADASLGAFTSAPLATKAAAMISGCFRLPRRTAPTLPVVSRALGFAPALIRAMVAGRAADRHRGDDQRIAAMVVGVWHWRPCRAACRPAAGCRSTSAR